MSINDWRSNARPPQFETLEQRIEREAHEERRRAFAQNVPGPRHATTVDPQAERDRRVGAAVREAYHYDADSLLHCAAFLETNGYDTAVPVLRAIAAALGEEAGR